MTYFHTRLSKSEFKFKLSKVESLQFSIEPGIPTSKVRERHGIAIESVWLEWLIPLTQLQDFISLEYSADFKRKLFVLDRDLPNLYKLGTKAVKQVVTENW